MAKEDKMNDVEQKGFIKLNKNAKGDRQWEIKVLDEDKDLDWVMNEVVRIDDELEKKFGGGEE